MRLGLVCRDGRTRLARLYQDGSGKVRFPRSYGTAMDAVLINTAGGLTGGDDFATEIEAGAGAHGVVTTQASEKVYRAAAGTARVVNKIKVGAGGRIDWLPQETILFNRSRLARRLEVELDRDATFLAVEAVVFGRHAMGERVEQASFCDSWRISRAGRIVHADEIAMDGKLTELLARTATMAGGGAMASLVYVAEDAEERLDDARDALSGSGGVSAWNGRLAARLVADTGLALRRHLVPLIELLLSGAPLPKLWTV